MKTTLIIGASENPERYSFKALKSLRAHGHPVKAIAPRPGQVDDVTFQTDTADLNDIDTVTLYVNPTRQEPYQSWILNLRPRRVIFNPGTENPAFEAELQKHGIIAEEACTLVLLATHQF